MSLGELDTRIQGEASHSTPAPSTFVGVPYFRFVTAAVSRLRQPPRCEHFWTNLPSCPQSSSPVVNGHHVLGARISALSLDGYARRTGNIDTPLPILALFINEFFKAAGIRLRRQQSIAKYLRRPRPQSTSNPRPGGRRDREEGAPKELRERDHRPPSVGDAEPDTAS